MLLSLLGSSFLNTTLKGGSFKDMFKNIGLGFSESIGNSIPSLFGSIGQSGKRPPLFGDNGWGRSLLESNKSYAKVGLLKTQREILRKARTAQGTISAYLAGRGFEKGGSTAMILSNQNISNAMEDIELAGIESRQRVLNASIRQLQDDYSTLNNLEAMRPQYDDPLQSFLKDSFQPMINQNFSSIGQFATNTLKGFFS